jgi:outer membrane receptor protein involved in Fe transport
MKIKHLLSATALVGIFASIPVAAFAQTAPAADTPSKADDAAADKDDTIIVTGSRIRRPNDESTVPITTVTAEDIFSTGKVQLGDILNDLPQLRSTLGSQNSLTGSLGLRGINSLDLRGLGTTRTLVLVNGRREVAADIINNRAIVDTNTFPTDLIERIDIVTGGNSSIYGSDAIAGVVNFILKDHYQGLQVHGQAGISQYGDAGNQYISVLAGKNFADGRGNIAINAEYAHQAIYFASDRPNFRHADGFVVVETDPSGSVNGSDGIPDRQYFQDLRSATISLGGQVGIRYANTRTAPCGIDSNPTTIASYTCGFLFQPDGSLITQTGVRVGLGPNGNYIGGNGYSGREGNLVGLTPELNRYAINAIGHFEISPAFVPFFEARFVRTTAFGSSSGPFFSQGQTLGDSTAIAGFTDTSYSNSATNTLVNREGIRLDNPYLSTAARATLSSQLTAAVNSGVNPNTGTAYATTAAGMAAQAAALAQIAAGTFRFSVRRNYTDLGIRDERLTRDTYKFVGGVRGDFNTDWHYEVSLNYGEHDETNVIASNINRQRFLLANDVAVNSSGQIVCRSQIDARYAGVDRAGNPAVLAADIAACVPLNPFGQGSVSAAARNYLTINTSAAGKSTQLVASGFVSGDSSQLFSLPGGPIGFSIGGEYRRESLKYTLDPTTQAGYAFYNAIQSFYAPKFEVKEAFGELSIPIVKDLPLLRELTLSGSGRVASYKGAVGTVYAYSGGVDYRPINDFHFRADYSKSVRSPYLGDLYSPTGQNFTPAPADPCSARNLASGTTYRAANCAAAGRPGGSSSAAGTYDFVYTSSLEIRSGGNPNLQAETSTSLTLGGVYTPHYVPGLSVSLDYYDITVNNVIAAVGAQQILNLCYDSATLNNPFCGLFQRAGASGGPRGEQQFRILEGSLLQSSANFAALKARGFDVNIDYTHKFSFGLFSAKGIWTHVIQRDNFNNPADPTFRDVITNELQDPQDTFNISANLKHGKLSFGYSFRWIGSQYLNAYEDYNSVNGQPPQNTDYAQIIKYPVVTYSDIRFGLEVNKQFDLSLGVTNLGDTQPPYGLTGAGGGAIYDNRGRFLYLGFTAKL